MRGKLLFLAGAATGYVFGSKAGRQAYEQIRSKAKEVWGSPTVKSTVSQAGQVARDAASLAQSKLSGATNQATDAMSDSTGDSGAPTQGHG